MSVLTLQLPRIRPKSRLLTAADLDALPNHINGSDVKYELYDGELVIMAPPGGEHGRRQHRIASALELAEDLKLGLAFAETGIVLRRDPDTVVGADAAFVLKASLPVQFTKEGYLATIPEIVIEVRSKNDSEAEVRAKALLYLEAGVREVWVVDPKLRSIVILSDEQPELQFAIADVLTSKLLPGFAATLAKIFA